MTICLKCLLVHLILIFVSTKMMCSLLRGGNEAPKIETNETIHTCEDYALKITEIFESGMKITMPSDSINIIFPKAKKSPQSDDTREEYVLKIENGGMQKATFMFDPDDKKQLFEAIFDFENADSTQHLAELMFGKPTHPTLDNHWILAISNGDNNSHIVSLAWVYENKLVVASNLPNTDLENDDDFKFSDEFIEKWNKRGMVDVNEDPNKPANNDELIIQQMNTLIAGALDGFENIKGEAVPDKRDEFKTTETYFDAEDCIIRKNASGNWRFEARFPTFSTIEDAKTAFENYLNTILNLEGLEYRLNKKSDISTKNGRTYICDVQTLDDKSLGIILKLQIYPTSNQEYGVKIELGK